MVTTSSAMRATVSRLWVMRSKPTSRRAATRSSSSVTTRLRTGSSPVSGSSAIITWGSGAMAIARAARWAIPPDSSLGRARAVRAGSPTSSRIRAISLAPSIGRSHRRRTASCSCLPRVRPGFRALDADWGA